jgi:hypothetical protein
MADCLSYATPVATGLTHNPTGSTASDQVKGEHFLAHPRALAGYIA